MIQDGVDTKTDGIAPDIVGAYGRTPLPKGWRWVRLGDVCQLNPSRPPRFVRPSDKPTTFVPMQAVNAEKGVISQGEIRPYNQVCKGFTYFAEDDVLFAKITPCMQNGKHAIAKDLIDGIGFGSTEFHVIRPGSDITSDWIHKFLRQPYILRSATAHFSGAVGQQRVPIGFIANLNVPLPPLPEQKRIAAILNEKMAQIEKARKTTEEQLEAAKALPAAYLRSVFNSPEVGAHNGAAVQPDGMIPDVVGAYGRTPLPEGWRWVRLGEVCDQIDYGFTASADFSIQAPKFLRITDIQNGAVDWQLVPGCKISINEETANTLKSGDIVFARTGGTTGKSFLIKEPPRAVFASYLIRLRPSSLTTPAYLYVFFQSNEYWKQIKLTKN